MNIQLKSIEDKDSFLIVTYEGVHNNSRTSLDFQIELTVYKCPGGNIKPVQVKKVTGFEHLEAESVPGIFEEIARVSQRMVDTLLHCTTVDVNLPTRMKETRSS